jgi:crotonobetainyl-CoA:carnitine CoA-transferase CaiB-like acyl-CoA transferase
LAESVAGEYCGKLLADFGAEIIKIERPGSGSPTRAFGPFAPDGADPERSGLFAYLNTNKHSVTLDLASDAGRNTLAALLRQADAVIDDHAPGWLKAVGLDPALFLKTYPELLLCAITPFGQDAPPDRAHAEDLTVLHASGWGYHTPSGAADSEPPLKGPGRFLVSYESGLEAALCMVAALYWREGEKRGQFIDISKQEVMASRVDYVLGQMVAGDMDVTTARTGFDLWGPATIYACREGFAYLWLSTVNDWKGLAKLLGNPDWMKPFAENWLEFGLTPERVAECRRGVGAWMKLQDKHEAAEIAQKLGLMLVPVNNAGDLQDSPQYQFRKFFAEVNHPVQGKALYPTVPYKLSVTPAVIVTPAPMLGQHNPAMAALTAAQI